METTLEPLGLTPAQYAALIHLSIRADQTNADLAVAAFITPQSMQAVLSKLEMAELVTRQQDATHGRRQLARLTEKGAVLTEKASRAVKGIEEDIEKAIAPLSHDDLKAALIRIQTAMSPP